MGERLQEVTSYTLHLTIVGQRMPICLYYYMPMRRSFSVSLPVFLLPQPAALGQGAQTRVARGRRHSAHDTREGDALTQSDTETQQQQHSG
jgi:hypothetical protein